MSSHYTFLANLIVFLYSQNPKFLVTSDLWIYLLNVIHINNIHTLQRTKMFQHEAFKETKPDSHAECNLRLR
jgi:hypothetical protein